ncbi:MAG: LamG-like jellyroll fold domain-containing protein [Gammaproteobacteria bacterium]|nr:LamG-like jellyroll fold domain-containing protein [Gammaproteobacteria bacterium]
MRQWNRSFGIAICIFSLGCSAIAMGQAYDPDVIELDGSFALDYPPDPQLVLANGGTIEFWVAPDWQEDPGYDPVIIANAGPQGPAYLIAMLRDRDGLAFAAGEEEAVFLFDFTDEQLHHVAVSQLDDGIVVLIDGRFAGDSDIQALDLPSAGFWVGSIDGENNQFRGVLAGLRVWSEAIDRDTLVQYALQDVVAGDHPRLPSLAAMSDFTNGELLVVEATADTDFPTE